VSAFAATTINYHLANTYKFGVAPGERQYFDYITLDLGSRCLYVSHGTEVLVVNADTGKAEGKISSASSLSTATTRTRAQSILGGGPEFAVADGQGMIYNNLEDKNDVVAMDSRNLQVKSRWPIAPVGAPTAIAMDREHRRLFVAGREPAMLAVMNADDGKVIQSFPISAGADADVYDAKAGLIFVSTREGWVHIFHEDSPDHYSEAGKVKTEFGAKTMAYDPETQHIFLDTAEFGKPPAATKERPNPRPAPIPGTFPPAGVRAIVQVIRLWRFQWFAS
jgi:outer membrane protein assembly factor BamB